MKYKLFRSPGKLDKAVRKHELVAVETGKNIDDVADQEGFCSQVHGQGIILSLIHIFSKDKTRTIDQTARINRTVWIGLSLAIRNKAKASIPSRLIKITGS